MKFLNIEILNTYISGEVHLYIPGMHWDAPPRLKITANCDIVF